MLRVMKGVIFDLDGTLVDSLDDIADALNHVLRELGREERDRATIERFVGDGARMLVRRALGDAREAVEDDALARFRDRYMAHLTERTRVYAGVPELLAALSRRGTPTAVLSNKPHDATVEVVRALLGDHPFAAVLGVRPGAERKPDPSGALELADALGLAPEDVLFVGDTPVDVRTAELAGMTPIAVLWGMRSREELEAAGAELFLSEPDELLALLDA